MVQPDLPSTGRGRVVFLAASLLALLLAAAAVLALTRTASAASETATAPRATLTIKGSAATSLRKARVTVGASRKATIKRSTVTMPVSVSVVGATAAVGLNGTLSFRSGKRTLSLTGLRVMVAKDRTVQVLARTKGAQFAVLTGKVASKALTLDRFLSTAAFTATSVKLTPRAGKLLKSTLRLRRTPTGTFGTLALSAAKGTSTTTTTTTTTTPGETTTTTTPVVPKVCQATAPATTAGSEAGWDQAPPSGAVDISSACITWHPRDSWTNYINGEPNGLSGARLGGGATADAPNAACGSLLQRDFHFQFHRGWFDPATGQAALQYDGTVEYVWPDRSIDITLTNPEIHLGGGQPQMRVRSGATRLSVFDLGGSPVAAQCPADPGPQGLNDPTGTGLRIFERLPATMSTDGAPLFDSGGTGGSDAQYPPGTPFGWLSVSFSPAS